MNSLHAFWQELEAHGSPPETLSGREYSLRGLRRLIRKLDKRLFIVILELMVWSALLATDVTAAFVANFTFAAYSLPITQLVIALGAIALIWKAGWSLFELGVLRYRIIQTLKRARAIRPRLRLKRATS